MCSTGPSLVCSAGRLWCSRHSLDKTSGRSGFTVTGCLGEKSEVSISGICIKTLAFLSYLVICTQCVVARATRDIGQCPAHPLPYAPSRHHHVQAQLSQARFQDYVRDGYIQRYQHAEHSRRRRINFLRNHYSFFSPHAYQAACPQRVLRLVQHGPHTREAVSCQAACEPSPCLYSSVTHTDVFAFVAIASHPSLCVQLHHSVFFP